MNDTDRFLIPIENVQKLRSDIGRLIKRAAKLGGTVTFREVGQVFEPVTAQGPFGPEKRLREYLQVEIEGEAPKLAGWTFLATLERISANGTTGTLISAVPGESIPESYRDVLPSCDHCQTSRSRKYTYVVRHDDGTHKQVGKQCLRDFLGHQDPKQIASLAELLIRLDSICGDAEEEGWGGGSGEHAVRIEDFLAVTAGAIRTMGWCSKGAAYNTDKTATVTDVWWYLFPPMKLTDRDREHLNKIRPTEEDKKLAADVLQWVRETVAAKESKSDYEHNLVLACAMDGVSHKTSGLVASAISVYTRWLGKEVERKQRESLAKNEQDSEWVGEPKERRKFRLTVIHRMALETFYGTSGFHKMYDENGNVFIWFASGNDRNWLEIGETYDLKATVKKHDTRDGVNQTILTRVADAKAK